MTECAEDKRFASLLVMNFAQQCKRRKNLSQSINEEEAMVEEKELRTV